MCDIKGLELTPYESELLQHPLIGGVILFAHNYQSKTQICALVDSIKRLKTPELLVAVDHEGGRVQRFRQGFTHLPAASSLGKIYQEEQALAEHLASAIGELMALELRAVGVDFSFAPVLDLGNSQSEVIGDRSIDSDPEVVSKLASRQMFAMQRHGMMAVGKHFPGHGGVTEDSHTELPVDRRSETMMFAKDIIPFAKLIRAGIAGIMSAHIHFPNIDATIASFSSFWLDECLRQRLGFQGVVFSDDINMAGAAISASYAERATAALRAGCDMIIICNNETAVENILTGAELEPNPLSSDRLARMRGGEQVPMHALPQHKSWQQAEALILKCKHRIALN